MKHPSRSSAPPRGPTRPSSVRSDRAKRGGDRARPENRTGALSPRLPKIILDLYGHHAVREAILNPARVIRAIYATPDQADMVDGWVRLAEEQGLKRPGVHIPPRPAFDAACAPGAVHQGVGLATDSLPDVDLDDILRGLPDGVPAVLVMLDQVTDPHNFGAILRSSCAFGAAAVIVQRRNAPDLTALVAKIACGAVDHIAVAAETNLSRAIEVVKEHGFVVMGLDERGDMVIGAAPIAPRTMIVLGAEGDGLRRLIREHCDHLVRLPTQEPIASLNVSNAAAVTLYALTAR